jgi:hypothetical protein
MKLFKWIFCAFLAAAVLSACSSATDVEAVEASQDEYRLVINTGEHWLHEFDLFLWFNMDNPPQYAIWMEGLDGNYLETIAVTEKMAKEKWIANDGNRRVEALPYWVHSRGQVYSDGLMLPNGNNPLPDTVTTASAKTDSTLGFNPDTEGIVRIIAEFNHSTDFNENYPLKVESGMTGYSGGEMGSGQPAVVYSVILELSELKDGPVRLNLEGHSSPDGTDGNLYPDCGSLTTALNIVDSVWIEKN